jgi:RND family efflux transporter MFP subunit
MPFRLIAALTLPCLVACAGCSDVSAPSPVLAAAQTLPTLEADLLHVEECQWPVIARAQGSLVADEVAIVGTESAGKVVSVAVEIGDPVLEGATLASVETDLLSLQVDQAAAGLSQARAAVGLAPEAPVESLNPDNSPPVREAQAQADEAALRRERAERLRTNNGVTEAELQVALAADRVARALLASARNSVNEKIALIGVRTVELELARQRLREAVTVAPFDGVVLTRHVAPGSYIQSGAPVVTLVRTSTLRFRGTLPERFARRLTVGQEVFILSEDSDQPIPATISRISPSLEVASRALAFEVDLVNDQGHLRAGSFAEADVVVDAAHLAIAVPESAIQEFAGVEKVWKVVEGKSIDQTVTTGARRDGRVEIRSGLASGDVILLNAGTGRAATIRQKSLTSTRPDDAEEETSTAENEASGTPNEASDNSIPQGGATAGP